MSVDLTIGRLLVSPSEFRRTVKANLSPEEVRQVISQDVDASQAIEEVLSLLRRRTIKRVTRQESPVEVLEVKRSALKILTSAVKRQAHQRLDSLDGDYLQDYLQLLELYLYLKSVKEPVYIFN